ncbi:hypothetical protein LCGC14_2431030 [marine sediment metagenome]|uniref:DUF3303 domain-containing protein n=1 Tax=marine sediment metagenome TaxID=412755 RepID=A0A0F9DYX3_9ZZZZ
MGKYLILWEIDASRLPVSRKERAAGWKALLSFIKKDIESGLTLDWGSFVGELKGYSIIEGDELAINISLQQYSPFVTFKLHAITSVEQAEQLVEAMAK